MSAIIPAAAVEHIAWQVADPVAVAKWYCEVLGFTVLRKMDTAPYMHFIADASGRVVIEIYNNPAASIPDYPTMSFFHLHLAFQVENPDDVRETLLKNGCTVADDLTTTPSGDRLLMMRDPWGFPIQFVKRAVPLK